MEIFGTIRHVLTKKQAQRLRAPHLEGREVSITLMQEWEKDAANKNSRIAKDVYLDGVRICSVLNLDE